MNSKGNNPSVNGGLGHSRLLKPVLCGLVAAGLLLGIGFGALIHGQSRIDMPAAPAAADPAALIKHGEYVARAADCVACHTSDKSRPYAGGVEFATPFGKLYSTNITQDRRYGIGGFTDKEIVGAIRNGISHAGRHLYPAMPYTSYSGMSDKDVVGLVAYLRTIKPIDWEPPANRMSFPFNQRWAMAFWNVLNFKSARQIEDPARSSQWNRGAYLVQTLEHCQECHSPRNLLQGLTTPALSGGVVGPWRAYNITPGLLGGIGGWSDRDIVDYLKTGVAHDVATANAAGPMAEVVENSTSKLADVDLQAMVTYLRSVPAVDAAATRPRYGAGKAWLDVDQLRNGKRYLAPDQMQDGAVLFNANCATCHSYSGEGVGEYPRLIGNTVLGDGDTGNLTQVILHGVHRKTAAADIFMPGFDNLSNAQIVALEKFLYQQFGHREAVPSSTSVQQAR